MDASVFCAAKVVLSSGISQKSEGSPFAIFQCAEDAA
jgi:hypothetical protein